MHFAAHWNILPASIPSTVSIVPAERYAEVAEAVDTVLTLEPWTSYQKQARVPHARLFDSLIPVPPPFFCMENILTPFIKRDHADTWSFAMVSGLVWSGLVWFAIRPEPFGGRR